MGKNDTLFKDHDPQKPYPLCRHTYIQPIHGSAPLGKAPVRETNKNYCFPALVK